MNKNLKKIGSGFVYGVKHPFKDPATTFFERQYDMKTSDWALDCIGMLVPQVVVQIAASYGVLIAMVIGVGYLSTKLDDKNVKVKMITEPKENK